MSTSSASKTTPSGFICEYCKISFTSQDEKEEHIKLEHSEHKQPSGVG
ncbi:MAG: hypothetical protein M3Z01_04950 [Thermoproteota archaeon]|nr:hypothetical protein [Thermoproteota archaeon]